MNIRVFLIKGECMFSFYSVAETSYRDSSKSSSFVGNKKKQEEKDKEVLKKIYDRSSPVVKEKLDAKWNSK